MSDEAPIDPEVVEVEESRELARPSIPVDVNELAALEDGRGVAIVQQRAQILETLRVAALRLIMPNDVVLFKSPDGIITGFIQDSGCDRIKKLFGIQIANLGTMVRIDDPDTGEFAFRITGDGTCGVTGEAVYDMEGIRYSTEPFAQQKPEGIQRVVAVQKAARANLDGGIARELAGLKSIPIEELTKAWEGTWKKWEMCSKGRGFGSGNERAGGASTAHGIDAADIPECDVCRIPLVFRPGKDGKEGFFGCKNWEKHKETKVIVPLSEARKIAERKQARTQQPREAGGEG